MPTKTIIRRVTLENGMPMHETEKTIQTFDYAQNYVKAANNGQQRGNAVGIYKFA